MPAPYHLGWSGALLARTKELYLEAKRLGIGSAFFDALRLVQTELQNRPLEFGDPAFTLQFSKIKIRYQMVRPILVIGAYTKSRLR